MIEKEFIKRLGKLIDEWFTSDCAGKCHSKRGYMKMVGLEDINELKKQMGEEDCSLNCNVK